LPILLLRHASAGDPGSWGGDDALRPLDPLGRRQADRIAAELAAVPVTRILASPYARCIQTVEALAGRIGLEVEQVAELGEGRGRSALGLLGGLEGTAVVCTHGDVVEAISGRVAEKAAGWLLDVEGAEVVRIRYLPAPGV
jgi:8-oxo-dGTP diphosphatase